MFEQRSSCPVPEHPMLLLVAFKACLLLSMEIHRKGQAWIQRATVVMVMDAACVH